MKVRLSTEDKLGFISTLGTMLTAGIPILEAVQSLKLEAKKGQRKILTKIEEDLNQGKTLADSLSKFPQAFDPVSVNLIKASEEAGNLSTTLKDLTKTLRKDIEFVDRVKAALTYPVVVMIVFVGVMLVILVAVIPRIATVFARLRIDLPLPTKILIFLSNAVVNYGFFVLGGLFILSVGVVVLYQAKRRLVINALFSLPILSTIARKIDLTRFTRSMSLLLGSGIPLVEALELSSKVVAKDDIARIIHKAREAVLSGKELAEGFKKKKVIPGIVVRIIESGEHSGTLDKSMQDLSEYFDDQVSKELKTATTLLEPIMLVVIGLLVGGMMLAILAPIYGLIGNIRGR